MRARIAAWAPPVLWGAALFCVSSLSRVPSPPVAGFDKVEHFTAYGILAWLACRAFAAARRDVGWGLVLVSLYGLTDEVHQAFVPGRSSDVFDWVADTAGAVAALYLFHRWHTRAARSASADGDRAPLPAPAHD